MFRVSPGLSQRQLDDIHAQSVLDVSTNLSAKEIAPSALPEHCQHTGEQKIPGMKDHGLCLQCKGCKAGDIRWNHVAAQIRLGTRLSE